MSKIEFYNRDIEHIHHFLTNIKLQGRTSRARSCFCRELERKYEEFLQAKLEIQKEYGAVDKEGNLIADENGTIEFETIENKRKCIEEVDKTGEEIAIIECTEILDKLQTLLLALDVLEEELEGEDAVMYDLVCTQLESMKERAEKGKCDIARVQGK